MTADERARCGDEPGITRKGASSAVYLLGVSVPGREGAPASQRRRRHAGRFGHRRQLPRSSLPTVVVGFSNDASGHGFKAFRWTAASGMVGLGFLPGGHESTASGVNADGTVVVGQAGEASGQHQAYRWTAASGMVGLGFLPGGNLTGATGVNANGTVVVGFSNDASGHGFKAFRWTAASGMVGLGFLPGGNQSSARGVNADGKVVVGQANDASDQPQAFRWTRATRMQSVLTLLLAAKVVTMTGWQLRSANGVSADGTVIVGDGVDPLGQSQAWIARLPKEDNEDCEEDDDNQGDNDNQGGDFGQ